MEFYELQQIVESNSRAIQALTDRIAEVTHDVEGLILSNRSRGERL